MFILKKGVTNSAASSETAEWPILTMETLSFEEINAEMDNSHIQHYISSLHGSLNAGEAVLLVRSKNFY